jgi:hypothetical protein
MKTTKISGQNREMKKICSQFRKTVQENKFAPSKNLLKKFARSIEKHRTMKNLAGLDG